MTLALTFRIKDAWVVVSDRKMISKDDNIKDADSLCIKYFVDNQQKIKQINHELIFVGAGNKEVLDKVVERINLSKNFEEFLDYLKIKMSEVNVDFGKIIDEEEFLIIEQRKQRAFKFKIKKINRDQEGCYSLNFSDMENNFIGCYENCINLGIIKLDIEELKNKTFAELDEDFYRGCNKILSFLAIDNLSSVGHPAIHGADIWIISKDKLKKIYTMPNNVLLWREEK